MSTNNNQIMKLILDDYYKCIGAFENCKFLYDEIIDNEDIYEKDSKEYLIHKARREDLISNLGKIGEKALKYIIGLELLRTNPNMDSKALDEFFRKQNPLKNFATRHGINVNDSRLNNLLNYSDLNNQKAHNFDYWYSVLELTMPVIIKKFKCLIYNSMQSTYIENYCKENGYSLIEPINSHLEINSNIYNRMSFYLTTIISPEHLAAENNKVLKILGAKNNFFIDLMLDAQRKNIKKCGDVFTRLRYASNNPDKKVFSLKKLYETISYFIFFITLIHENNDDLDVDLEFSFAKHKIIEFKSILGVSEEEINKIFKHYIINGNDLTEVLHSKFSLHEIAKMIDLGVKKDDLFYVIEFSKLNARVIEYYKSIGITDYQVMVSMLEKYLEPYVSTRRKEKY